MASKGNEQRFYFSVGTSDAHATVWRLWTTRLGDVYLGSRFHAGQSKLSIHVSGLRLFREKGIAPDVLRRDGDIVRWQARPRHYPGYERVWRIITPATDLREARLPDRFTERVRWITPGAAGTVTDFELVLTFGLIIPEGHLPYPDPSKPRCLLRWPLATGESLFLLHRTTEVTAEHAADFEYERAQGRSQLPNDWRMAARADKYDLRLLTTRELPEMNFRGCYDFAVDP